MAKFNLENYETVEDRLKAFWNDNPNARISTEVVHMTDDGTCVTIIAHVFKQAEDDKPVTTGIAQETKGQGGFANTDAWVENCETSAIGRALANWKYQGSNKPRPSQQEMMKVGNDERVKVTKVDKRKKENKETQDVKDITEESLKKFEQDIGYDNKVESTNATQIGKLIAGFGLTKDIEDTVKKKSFNQFVGAGHNKNVEEWDNDTIGAYLDLFEQLANELSEPSETELVEEVFGDVEVSTVRKCPDCGSTEWIEDNREKKKSDQKFANIPSWSCNKYPQGGKNGCGWTAWGDTDCPTEWL